MRNVGVGCAAVTLVSLWLAPAATASPPLPSIDAISPGVGLATYNATATDGNTCTAGFLVRTRTGQPAMLTAGHCDEGGPVDAKFGASYTEIGAFTASIHQGEVNAGTDIGLVSLAAGLPANPAIAGLEPVTGATGQLSNGEMLCKFGLITDRQCGPITDITASKVVFTATAECGDSGGPVYAINPDGSVSAVGITIGASMGDDSVPAPCGSPYTQSVAELIQPWLAKWALTVWTS
jgi:hypothetical protein